MSRGGKRTGAGRPKGSLGVMTERVLDLLEELDFDPVLELVTLYRDPETDKRTKVRIASELAQFVAPKLKAIDVQAVSSQAITVNLLQLERPSYLIQIDAETPKAFLDLRNAALPE